jgi:DNA-binding response OmpR family regulator
MKVLVIDDDPDVVEVVSLTFEMRWPDSTIVSALDGDTGIQMTDTEWSVRESPPRIWTI